MQATGTAEIILDRKPTQYDLAWSNRRLKDGWLKNPSGKFSSSNPLRKLCSSWGKCEIDLADDNMTMRVAASGYAEPKFLTFSSSALIRLTRSPKGFDHLPHCLFGEFSRQRFQLKPEVAPVAKRLQSKCDVPRRFFSLAICSVSRY